MLGNEVAEIVALCASVLEVWNGEKCVTNWYCAKAKLVLERTTLQVLDYRYVEKVIFGYRCDSSSCHSFSTPCTW